MDSANPRGTATSNFSSRSNKFVYLTKYSSDRFNDVVALITHGGPRLAAACLGPASDQWVLQPRSRWRRRS